MKQSIKTLEPNLKGRDYIIGDLHGAYSVFQNLLKNLNFNPDIDRIISVGDLVDRGPQSLECLELIKEPWFHSVLANHEQMMLQKFNGGYMGNYWFQNGGEWGQTAVEDYRTKDRTPLGTSSRLFDLLPLVNDLPYLITVTNKSGKKFHIIHAELPHNTISKITDEVLADPEAVFKLATTVRGDGHAFLWERNIFYSFFRVNLSNNELNAKVLNYNRPEYFNNELSHIISGHTILQKPLTLIGQTNIDTGAYSSYNVNRPGGFSSAPEWAALTCIEIDSWSFYQATETTFRTVNETKVI